MEPLTVAFLLVMFLMGEQAIFAFVFHFLHISTGLLSVGITNVLLGGVLFFVTRKIGKQSYEKIDVLDIVSVVIITAVVLVMFNKIWGFSFRIMAFGSEDGVKVHHMLAEFLAEHGYYENIQYFEALNGALWMRIFQSFHIYYGHDRAHMLTQFINLWLSAFGFYILLSTYRIGVYATEKKRHITAAVVTVFYLLGYPLYAAMFGFAYFVQIVNIIVAILVIYNLLREEAIGKHTGYILLNVLLFGMFPCYSFFVPLLFPALFLAIWSEYKEQTGKWISLDLIKKEAQVFLLPCIFGLINSFSNVKELGEGGGITNVGGCYFDLYSNFLRLAFFVVIGITVVWEKRKNDIVLWMTGWTLFVFVILLALNHKGKISLYYISKVYNILWLCCFVLTFLAFVRLWEKMPVVIIGLIVVFILSIGVNKSDIPKMIMEENDPGYITVYDTEHGIYPNVYWFNEQWVIMLHNQTHPQ